MSLAHVRRRPNLGHVAGGPPDRGDLGLRRASPGEDEEYEERVGERSLGSSAAAATTMFGFPVLTALANRETAAPETSSAGARRVGRHRPILTHQIEHMFASDYWALRDRRPAVVAAAIPPSDGRSPK